MAREIRYMRPRFDQGEGSRGGKVIGHTSSGKPIYENHSHPGHTGFSIVEHHAARGIHEEKARSARSGIRKVRDPGIRASMEARAAAHDEQAALHDASAEARRKPAKPPSEEQREKQLAKRMENIRAKEMMRR